MNINLVSPRRVAVLCALAVIWLVTPRLIAQVQSATSALSPGEYACVQRGPDSKIWQRSIIHTHWGPIRTDQLPILATNRARALQGQ
jgi:hypothetical protein